KTFSIDSLEHRLLYNPHNAMQLFKEARTQNAGSSDELNIACVTEPLYLFSKSGNKLSAYLDKPKNLTSNPGVVVIAPAYGETKENNIIVSSYFVSNGFCAIRFDWSQHVGESDGDIFTCRLSKMMDDLMGLIEHQRTNYGKTRIGVVATSLAGRVAL